MEIKICGPGCAKCDDAYALAERVAQNLPEDITLTKVTDFQEIAMLGIFSTPAVAVDGVIKCVGRVPKEEELLSWLK
jgi:small redox-active disulfide protein 2